MDAKPQLTAGPFGKFFSKKNGLIYFYMPHGAFIDKRSAEVFLSIVHDLDDSGRARILIICSGCKEPTDEAQYLLLNDNLIAGLAFIAQTKAQKLSAERFLGLTKPNLTTNFPVKIFQHVQEAEAWLLFGSATNKQS